MPLDIEEPTKARTTAFDMLRRLSIAQGPLEHVVESRIDEDLFVLSGLVGASGELRFHALSRRGSDMPLRVIVIRDGAAYETLTLTAPGEAPADIPEGAQLLEGRSRCGMLESGIGAATGRLHAVCEGVIVFEQDVTYLEPRKGHVDRVQNGRISGWIVDMTRPAGEAEVELLIDGVPHSRRPVTVRRDDVGRLYPGYDLCGFEFPVLIDELPQKALTVDVRLVDSDYVLNIKKRHYSRPVGHKVAAPAQALVPARPVSVIVPVYNAPQELRECIDSLLMHTRLGQGGHRVIFSDDASPDPEVRCVFDEYDGIDGLVFLRNDTNRGYTGNVNLGIETARGIDAAGDVVLLNSDTRVTPQWLELLQRSAMRRPSIGTVSALSDNAGAYSVPVRNASNPVPPWMTEDDHARMITRNSLMKLPTVPTTSGFCMYIKQGVFADIGLFDGENFPRGYGEENDFCMRAGYAGWEHAIADNLIIYHERSASFLGAKTALMDRASELVPQMYPEYGKAVYFGFAQSPAMNQMRFSVGYDQLREAGLARPRVAFVIGVDSGGTPQTNMDLMSSIQTEYEPWLIMCTTGIIRIYRIVGNQRIEVERIGLKNRVMPIGHDSDSYRVAIADILQRYAFELVHIRHIGRHGLSLIPTAKSLGIPVLFSLHDFYTLCPNVKLLDAENRYCAGTCTEGGGECNVELWDHRYAPKLKHAWINSWRKMFQHVMPMVDGFITTSPYARGLIQSTYDIEDVRFEVIPHARDFDAFTQQTAALAPGEKLRIFVPGHIVPAKGLDLIREIKALDTEDRLEFHFAGMSKADLTELGIYHGPYERDAFDQLVADIRPHIGAVMSIWPETYSHTLTELWSCGVPVLTSGYGATGERVGLHGGGWAMEDMSAEAVFGFLEGLLSDASDVAARQAEVLDWQQGYGRDYSIAIMAERYKRLYRQTMRRAPGREAEVIVLPFGGRADAFEPVGHLRALLAGDGAAPHMMVWPQQSLNMLGDIGAPDTLVIRYHAEPQGMGDVVAALEQARAAAPNMALVLELALDALPVSDTEGTLADRPVLAWLLDRADRIIGPDAHVSGAALPAPIDLTPMLADPEDAGRLPETPAAQPSGLLPDRAEGYGAQIAARMDSEVLPGSAAQIHAHNAHLVAANFTLIDWDAMITRPRRAGMVSLVMPTFNRVGLTEKFLRSIIEHTKGETEYEIIVIDNGSVPEARVQVEAFEEIDPRIRVVCAQVPLMFSVGCNYGASFARGEYILFVNNDMEAIAPNWLDALMAPIKSSADVGIVGGRLLFGDRTVQHAGLAFTDRTKLAYHMYLGEDPEASHVNRQRVMPAVTGACMAMRATDWAKLRGFSPLYLNGCEDVDLCLRMRDVLKRKSVYVPDSLLLHHEGKSPGRGKFILHNRRIFVAIWGDAVRSDEWSFYRRDGIAKVGHELRDNWLKPDYRSVKLTIG